MGKNDKFFLHHPPFFIIQHGNLMKIVALKNTHYNAFFFEG